MKASSSQTVSKSWGCIEHQRTVTSFQCWLKMSQRITMTKIKLQKTPQQNNKFLEDHISVRWGCCISQGTKTIYLHGMK